MNISLRDYRIEDAESALPIWNEVVEAGDTIPFQDLFSAESLHQMLAGQTASVAAVDDGTGELVGMYILHPNLSGRCGSIANATYVVDAKYRGKHIGEQLVRDSLKRAKEAGFRIMQFNGVVDSNIHARHLYERIGFQEAGIIPKGFQVKDGHFEDMHIMYYNLYEV